MINRLTYTVIDCYWGPKESITITSNNKSFQLLIDKFRQSPCTSTSYTHVRDPERRQTLVRQYNEEMNHNIFQTKKKSRKNYFSAY